MSVKLLTEHNLEFLSLKGGCTGLSESILVKMPHCWKSHAAAHIVPRCAVCKHIYNFKLWFPSLNQKALLLQNLQALKRFNLN